MKAETWDDKVGQVGDIVLRVAERKHRSRDPGRARLEHGRADTRGPPRLHAMGCELDVKAVAAGRKKKPSRRLLGGPTDVTPRIARPARAQGTTHLPERHEDRL